MEGQEQHMITITVVIAGRPYPLRIEAREEAAIRRIVKEVNDKINNFQLTYKDRDKQDCLSMTVLTYAVELDKAQQAISAGQPADALHRVHEIDALLNKLLT